MPARTDPEIEEILQEEPTDPALPVAVEGPVRVQQLPARIGVMKQVKVGSSTPVTILQEDPRRRRAVILSVEHMVYLGTDVSHMHPGYAAVWPILEPLEITHADRVYALCLEAGQETTVTVISEEWAD